LALNNQIHIYSVDTSAFYNEKEKQIDKYLSTLRKLKETLSSETKFRKKDKNGEFKNETLTKYAKYRCEKFAINHKDKYKEYYSRITSQVNCCKKYLKYIMKQNNKIRILNSEHLIDKNVISVFESTLTRVNNMKIDELTLDMIVVQTYYYEITEQIIKNGFYLNGEKYKYLTASAGQIRVKKNVFVKESIWEQCEKTLMCGLTINKINELGGINVNKFLAYLALSNSATDEWKEFDINKCIVVNDFETKVNSQVDFISDITYEIERKQMDIPITHTDGCGIILPKLSKKNFMVRLPWVKGLLASFDCLKFIKENNCSSIVKDIYGKEWDIIKDDIQIIFTKSQFKMHKYYKDWQEYKDFFKEYNCQAGICNMEDDYFKDATINYQMLQTLTDITEEEIDKLLEKSRATLKHLAKDRDTMLKIFGATDKNNNKDYLQEALTIYPELLQDEYCKYTLRQIKNSLVKEFKAGKLEVNGKYTFLIPDLYAFCEHLFLGIETPNGLLNNGEVYCNLFKNYNKIDCLRSPHLFREHAVRNNIMSPTLSKWFKTKAIYTSSHDIISKILQFDVDGDKVLAVVDENIISIAERNNKNDDIVPLYYEMRKANPTILNSNTVYDGLNSAYVGGNIGEISNSITKIWNKKDGVSKDDIKIIKLLCMENNFTIDFAKTLYKPTRPQNIHKKINKLTKVKVPHFFLYAKSKKYKKHDKVEIQNNSLVDSFNKRITNPTLRYDKDVFGKLNYKMLMNNTKIKIDEVVIKKYEELNQQYHFRLDNNSEDINRMDYVLNDIKKELLNFNYSESDLTDMLIKYLFTKRTDRKKVLWKCFGNIIVDNLKRNINENSKMCEKCGKRFLQEQPNQKLCYKCSTYQPIGTKIIKCIDCGKEVEVDAKDNYTCRCEECVKIHKRELNNIRKQRQRAKEKSRSQF